MSPFDPERVPETLMHAAKSLPPPGNQVLYVSDSKKILQLLDLVDYPDTPWDLHLSPTLGVSSMVFNTWIALGVRKTFTPWGV